MIIGMFFYLVPFQLLKYKLPERVAENLSLPITIRTDQNFYKAASVGSILTPGESIWIPKWICTVLIIWMVCVVLFALYEVIKYKLDIRKLMAQSEKTFADVNGKKTELLVSTKIHTPYTVGFLKQSIIVPKGSQNHPCFSMFYRHEECHRKNYDCFMKLICIVVICVHWMNPIAYLLLPLYSITAEYICDAYAIRGCTESEKKEYLQLIINLSAKDEPLSVIWKSNLSGSGKLLKRRINYMMKKRKTGMVKKGVTAVICAVTVFASASTILAYEPFWSTDEEAVEILEEGEFGNFTYSLTVEDLDFSNSNCVFVYEDGTQVPISDESSSYALCNHVMESGYYNLHKSNSSGGCTIYQYNAQRCTKCGYTEIGTLNNTITYAVCPHT
ncbi:MAG: M56 family metallopeptidase [Fusicatenibacter sp.]